MFAYVGIKTYINNEIALNPIVKVETKVVDTSPEMFAKKIDTLEKSVVEAVRNCERGGYNESYGLVTYDPKQGAANNDKAMSYGTLQFKKSTVVYYYKSLYKKDITGKEAILIALDDGKSGDLAQDIMFKSPNLATDWLNCSNRLSLETMITAIKKIK